MRISLSKTSLEPGRGQFPVIPIPQQPPQSPIIAACVCPLFGKIPVIRLMAWIEMNRLVGVDHFMFYDYSISPDLKKLLAYYQAKGVVSLVKWNTQQIPISKAAVWPPPKNQVHYYGQFAAFNDCLYRLKNHYRFVMFTDLDEMIVPLGEAQISSYLQRVDTHEIAEFRFRNTYLREDYPKDPTARKIAPDIAAHNIPYLDFTRREKRILSPVIGPKAIVKSEKALMMGVHGLIRMQPNTKTFDVPPEKARLFHYRSPPLYLNVTDEGEPSERLVQLIPKLIAALREAQASFAQFNPNMLYVKHQFVVL